MLEEFIGSKWHRFITTKAQQDFPDEIIYLNDLRPSLGIFFRALGGEGGLRVESSTDFKVYARRSIMQKLAGTGKKTQYAWRDEETLRLPESIALFPSRRLNSDLYLWLTALSVISAEGDNWISRNQQRTFNTLRLWPGLKTRYENLLEAHLLQRKNLDSLPAAEAKQEKIIQSALRDPNVEFVLEYAKHPPQPVPLWLHPSPPEQEFNQRNSQPNSNSSTAKQKQSDKKKAKRKQADRTEMPDGDSGLMSFRLESLWSWAEYSKVDRTSTDDDDDDALKTADDMDKLTLAQEGSDTSSLSSKIKLDLDLPSSRYDDIVLGEGIPVDEWDFKQQRLQKDHCRIIPMVAKDISSMPLPKRLRAQAKMIQHQFELLCPHRCWLGRQADGQELDLENYINLYTDRKQGRVTTDFSIYRQLQQQNRSLSCLLLADLSLSTDAYINNNDRVIDLIRDALYLFSEALSATADQFALHGFSSRNRDHVRFYNIKNFADPYDDFVRGHIDAIKPGYYTRLGTAIRYASGLLEKQDSASKLLLILTDGKPNDLDKYEGRYGVEDTRMAVLEAQNKGLQPFCVTIDQDAQDYLPYLFGNNAYISIKKVEELPRKLAMLYLSLTQNK